MSVSRTISEETSLPARRALLWMIPFCLPGLGALGAFVGLWGAERLSAGIDTLFSSPLLIGLSLAGVFAHEAIHAATARWVGAVPARHIRFGFDRRMLAPYAHFDAPMTVAAFRWTALAPTLVLALPPLGYALAVGDGAILAFAALFLFGGAGDFLAMWLTRRLAPEQRIRDHPARVGFLLEA